MSIFPRGGAGHRRKATGRGGAGHHQKATGRGEAPRATGRYPGPYFPVFFWRSGLKSGGVWTKCRPLFDKPFIIFEAMSSKRKSGKGKAAAGTGSAADSKKQRVGVFAVDLSAEKGKVVNVTGEYWGMTGDGKHKVFQCDVLEYDPGYKFPNLRKDDVCVRLFLLYDHITHYSHMLMTTIIFVERKQARCSEDTTPRRWREGNLDESRAIPQLQDSCN